MSDEAECAAILDSCTQSSELTVTKVETSSTYKRRPVPLNTVEAQKLISRKLKISPAKCMDAMEALYNRGVISYPRTETTKYNETINLWAIVRKLAEVRADETAGDGKFQEFAGKLLDKELGLYGGPRDGGKDDRAHPPIHPVRLARPSDFKSKQEEQIYLLLVKHFLASVSRDATGVETKLECQIGNEIFDCQGLRVTELNFLEVYDYE